MEYRLSWMVDTQLLSGIIGVILFEASFVGAFVESFSSFEHTFWHLCYYSILRTFFLLFFKFALLFLLLVVIVDVLHDGFLSEFFYSFLSVTDGVRYVEVTLIVLLLCFGVIVEPYGTGFQLLELIPIVDDLLAASPPFL